MRSFVYMISAFIGLDISVANADEAVGIVPNAAERALAGDGIGCDVAVRLMRIGSAETVYLQIGDAVCKTDRHPICKDAREHGGLFRVSQFTTEGDADDARALGLAAGFIVRAWVRGSQEVVQLHTYDEDPTFSSAGGSVSTARD